jgi:tRNA(Ile)-lysidine synthetase-like protein
MTAAGAAFMTLKTTTTNRTRALPPTTEEHKREDEERQQDIHPNHHQRNDTTMEEQPQQSPQQRIRNNQQNIQKVLQYWFGQYPPETSQKMLWMIAASSVQHREKVDSEIANQFESILVALSKDGGSSGDKNDNEDDNDDKDEDSKSSTLWKEWCVDEIYGAHGKIAAIIVLDQFSRHILRHYQTITVRLVNPNHSRTQQQQQHHHHHHLQQSSLDRLALKTAKLFVKKHTSEIHCGMIPLPMYIFALMPYRHASTIDTVQYVLQCIEDANGLQTQMEETLGRFRKATNRRMALLQDEARRTHGHTRRMLPHASAAMAVVAKDDVDVDACNGSYTDEDILETFPFDADLTSAPQHPIHKTIVQFLADRGIHPVKPQANIDSRKDKYSSSSNNNNNNTNTAHQTSISLPSAAVIVSLSGGVDSMVIASVLSHLKQSCGYDHLRIMAVHIDYANRPESGAEADFVQRYCDQYLNIDFQCRRIGEVTRGVTARDDYERIAREIRYNSYREAVEAINRGMQEKDQRQAVVGVMLGHHRGDLRENVLSNAHKGCGPLDLSGMTAVSKNDGVIIYRPLLPLEKSFVLDYAHKFGIPYFKDTTPHWSTRGKLRNQLLPLLEDIYGDGSMNNLSNLAVESDECRSLLQKSMIGPFLESIVRKPLGIIMETDPWKNQPVFFWKVVLREALHSASLGMFSDKSVLAFLERIKAKKLKSAWLQCRKDYGVYLKEDGKVLVFFPTSFPWNKNNVFGVDGQCKFCQ